jgi:hypothetical protein
MKILNYIKSFFKRKCKHEYIYRWSSDLEHCAVTCIHCGFFKIVKTYNFNDTCISPEYSNNVVHVDFASKTQKRT